MFLMDQICRNQNQTTLHCALIFQRRKSSQLQSKCPRLGIFSSDDHTNIQRQTQKQTRMRTQIFFFSLTHKTTLIISNNSFIYSILDCKFPEKKLATPERLAVCRTTVRLVKIKPVCFTLVQVSCEMPPLLSECHTLSMRRTVQMHSLLFLISRIHFVVLLLLLIIMIFQILLLWFIFIYLLLTDTYDLIAQKLFKKKTK